LDLAKVHLILLLFTGGLFLISQGLP